MTGLPADATGRAFSLLDERSLLEETYREKKANLISALEGGEDDD